MSVVTFAESPRCDRIERVAAPAQSVAAELQLGNITRQEEMLSFKEELLELNDPQAVIRRELLAIAAKRAEIERMKEERKLKWAQKKQAS